MPFAPVVFSGLEHRKIPAATAETHFLATAGAPTADTTVKKNGAASLKCVNAAAANWVGWNAFASQIIVVFGWFRVEATPTGASPLIFASAGPTNNFSLIVGTGGTINQQIGSAIQASSVAWTATTWYWYSALWLSNATTYTAKWSINGILQTDVTLASQTIANMTTVRVGNSSAATTCTVYVDDFGVSLTQADYPVREKTVGILIPDGCGTHSLGAGAFQKTGAVAIVGGETTSWQEIDTLPPVAAGSYVAQTAIAATTYVDYTLQTVPANIAPLAISALAWFEGSATAGYTFQGRLWDGTTETADITTSSATKSATTLRSSYHVRTTTPSGTAITEANMANLEFRFGYSSDVTPNPRLDSFLVEYIYDTTVAFDAATNGANNKTFSHTCTGNNRYLVVEIQLASATVTSTGVTYGGVAMSLLRRVTNTNTVELWGLVAPATGANNVVITLSGADPGSAEGAVSFTNVDQTSPTGNTAQATGSAGGAQNGPSQTTLVGGMIVEGIVGSGFSVTGQTQQSWNDAAGDGSSRIFGTGSAQNGTYSFTAGAWAINSVILNALGTVSGTAYTETGTATVTFTPSGTDLHTISDAGTATLTLTPSAAETHETTDSGTALITFTASGTDIQAKDYQDSGTAQVTFTPSGTDIQAHGYADAATAQLTLTPNSTEGREGLDAATAQVTFTPSATEFIGHTYLDSNTAQVIFTSAAVEIHEISDAATALVTYTASGADVYVPGGSGYIDANTALLTLTPSGTDLHTTTDANTSTVTFTPSAVEGREGLDTATALVTFTSATVAENRISTDADTATVIFTPSSVELHTISDASTALVTFTPSGTDVQTSGYQDSGTATVTFTSSTVENTQFVESATGSVTFTPGGTDTKQNVDVGQASVVFTPASIETHETTDAAVGLVVFTAAGVNTLQAAETGTALATYIPSALENTVHTDADTAFVNFTSGGADVHVNVDAALASVTFTPSALELYGRTFTDTGTANVTFTPGGTEFIAVPGADVGTAFITFTPATVFERRIVTDSYLVGVGYKRWTAVTVPRATEVVAYRRWVGTAEKRWTGVSVPLASLHGVATAIKRWGSAAQKRWHGINKGRGFFDG